MEDTPHGPHSGDVPRVCGERCQCSGDGCEQAQSALTEDSGDAQHAGRDAGRRCDIRVGLRPRSWTGLIVYLLHDDRCVRTRARLSQRVRLHDSRVEILRIGRCARRCGHPRVIVRGGNVVVLLRGVMVRAVARAVGLGRTVRGGEAEGGDLFVGEAQHARDLGKVVGRILRWGETPFVVGAQQG